MAAVVIVPLAIVKTEEGGDLYLYKGAILSDGLADGEIERLVDGGFAEQLNDPESEASLPDGVPNDSWNVKQIDAYAAAAGIDLSSVSKKAEKLDLIAQA